MPAVPRQAKRASGVRGDVMSDRRRTEYVWDIRWVAVGKIMVGLFLLSLFAGVANQIRDVAVWALAAAFFAIALNPLVSRLEPRLGRTTAVTVVFFGFVVA